MMAHDEKQHYNVFAAFEKLLQSMYNGQVGMTNYVPVQMASINTAGKATVFHV